MSYCRRRWVWLIAAVVVAGAGTAWDGAAAQTPTPDPAGNGSAVENGADLKGLLPDQVLHVLGRDVMSATGEKMGRIVDVLFDHSGRPLAAVIDFGGFLGVGTRKIAIDWNALRFDLGEKKNIIALDLGREQLRAAPEYKESGQIAIVTLPQLGTSQASSGGVP